MPAEIEACVAKLKDKPGIDNPYALCQWMRNQGITLPGGDTEAADAALKAVVEQFNHARRPHEHGDLVTSVKVDRTQPGWVVLRGAVATREGVWNKAYRPWDSIKATYKRLEGKPLIIEDHRFFNQPRVTLGDARDVRLDEQGRRLVYDAWLFAGAIEGRQVDDMALFFNRALAKSVEEGRPVHNSIGYASRDEAKSGVHNGVPYETVRHHEDYEHIAILPTKRGACPTEAGCGLGVDAAPDPARTSMSQTWVLGRILANRRL